MSKHLRFRGALAIIAIVALFAPLAAAAQAGQPQLRCRWNSPNNRRPLDLTFGENPLVVMLPGDNLELSVAPQDPPGTVTILKDGNPVREDATVNLTAPDRPGSYYIILLLNAAGQRRDMEICVLVPHRATAEKAANGSLLRADGQEIGIYRHPARSGNHKVRANPDRYQAPLWWMRLTDMNRNFEIVPGLAAGNLVVPSEDTGLPHTDLVPVCYPMWTAVNTLRKGLESRGIPPSSLRIISAFRSPPYNRRIGSGHYGRHIYGDAFDFYIDIEGDGKASDLNRDGRLDRQDAYPVVALIEDLQADGELPMGGIGVYNTVAGDHVVTMHLDMRGHRATWGYLYGASGKKSEFSWGSRRFAELDSREEDAAAARAAGEGRKYARPRREPLP